MYAETKKIALRNRKTAIKNNIPKQFLAMADSYLDKSIFIRKRNKIGSSGFSRAIDLALTASNMYSAQYNGFYQRLPNKLLAKEV